MRARLSRWIKETNDRGQQPESAAMFDSDMKVYLTEVSRQPEEHRQTIRDNIALMKKWAAAGK